MAVSLLTALVSCSDDTATATYTVGAEDNAITLNIGVDNAPAAMLTRGIASGAPSRADETRATTPPTYVALTPGTGIRLRVEGAWTKGETTTYITEVIHAQAGNQESEDQVYFNKVTDYSPLLFWDDFGTADPGNAANKAKGLAIYAVAINGMSTAPTVNKAADTTTDQWGDHSNDNDLLTWNTEDSNSSESESTTGTDLLLKKDLLVSNTLSEATEATPATATNPGRLTFEEHKAINRSLSGYDVWQSRLIFHHVFCKLTFKLKANAGFTDKKFQAIPTTTLKRNTGSGTPAVTYCYMDGTVNIKQCKATHNNTPKLVTAKLTGISTSEGSNQVVTKEVIVYPGTPLCSTDDDTNDQDIIAQLNADGNIYYIRARQIKAAIQTIEGYSTTDAERYMTKPGYNYVFNVTVNKTGITVTATVSDWQTVEADHEPKINVTANVGSDGSGTNSIDGFSFYRWDKSTSNVYNPDLKNTSSDFYQAETTVTLSGEGTKKTGTFDNQLYWPDHQTHYHFRGVYPKTTTGADINTLPAVKDVDGVGQCIRVWNCKYSADKSSFPSNLLIGAPEFDADTQCDNPDHTPVNMNTEGICAREGAVNMNFRYMMSQVVVNLSTSTGTDAVRLDSRTKVELEHAQTDGWVKLHERTIAARSGTQATPYLLNTVDDKPNSRHDAIVPQSIENIVFKISILNEEGKVTDIYRANVKDIPVYQVDSDGNKVGVATSITEWQAGVKYIYNLKVTKTKVSITATITDWETRQSSTDIWL